MLCPVLPLPVAESVLDLEPFEVLTALPKKSYSGLFPTVSSIEGLKRPERLDISPLSSLGGDWVKPVLEPLLGGYCNDWLRGLTESLSVGLAEMVCCAAAVGEADCLAPLRIEV